MSMKLKLLYLLETMMLIVCLVGCSKKDENKTEEPIGERSTEQATEMITTEEVTTEAPTTEVTTTEELTTENELVAIPELTGTDQDVAQTVLLNNGLIPMVDYTYTTVTNSAEYYAYDMDANQFPTFAIDLNQLGLYSPNISSITLNLPYECMNGGKMYTFSFNFVWQ